MNGTLEHRSPIHGRGWFHTVTRLTRPLRVPLAATLIGFACLCSDGTVAAQGEGETNLPEVTIQLPERPSDAEATAALRVAAAAARRSPDRELLIRIVSESTESDSQKPASTPDVVIRRGSRAAGTDVANEEAGLPGLILVDPDESPQELSAWLESLDRGSPGVAAAVPGDGERRTLADMGYSELPPLTTEQNEVRLSIAQADWGRPIGAMKLSIRGSAASQSPGSWALLLLINGSPSYSWPLDRDGAFELEVDLSASQLRRDNNITLRLVPAPQLWTPEDQLGRAVIYVDTTSTLSAQSGQTLQPGFQRFPQTLFPEFQVAGATTTIANLQGAAQMVATLQRASRIPLRPTAVPWSVAVTGTEPLLALAGTTDRFRELAPPVSPEPFRLVGRDGTDILTVEEGVGFSLLQAYSLRGRDLLLLGSREDPDGMAHLPRQIAVDGGWRQLSGDNWLLPEDGMPLSIPIHDKALRAQPLRTTDPGWWQLYRTPLFLVVAALLAMSLIWVYPRVVRSEVHA
jgi:hypothetical protein